MRRTLSGLSLSISLLTTGSPTWAQHKLDGEPSQPIQTPTTQLIVRYRDDSAQSFGANVGSAKTDGLGRRTGAKFAYRRPMSGMAHVLALPQTLARAEAIALTKRLEMDPNVLYAEIDEWLQPQLTPNDEQYFLQWHYKTPDAVVDNRGGANLPLAWDSSRGSGVIIAVIDTGVAQHPDLTANVIMPGGYDFIGDVANANDGNGRDPDPSDPGDWRSATDCPGSSARNSSWHGSHVSGTIAGVTNNLIGIAGVAHQARILALRTLGRCGGFSSDTADAIRWAAGLPVPGIPNNPNVAKVINMSLGSASACGPTTQSAVNDARVAGVAIFAATGNDGMLSIGQPAACQGVVAVTAHTFQGDNADYANVGPGTAISAPGGGSCATSDGAGFTCVTRAPSDNFFVWSTALRGITTPTSLNAAGTASGPSYFGKVGTSMATPHAAGVAGLLVSRMPTLTPDEITFVMTSSARPHPAGLYCATAPVGTCGSGLLDGLAALNRLSDRTPMLTVTPSGAVVAGGEQALLTATATARNGGSNIFTYTWTQTTGPVVILTNAATATPSFLGANPGGTHGFRLVLQDANGYRVTQTVSVRSNNAPTITPIAPIAVVQSGALTFNVVGVDPEQDSLTYVATNLPAGATFAAATGQFSWQGVSAALGSYAFEVIATDGLLNSPSISVTVNVVTPPPPPPPSDSGGGGSISVADLLALALLIAGLAAGWRRRPAFKTSRR